jgi:ectoine hydroxylase-related dioxygenase (phytanoyl-CoA dioxygenase family)
MSTALEAPAATARGPMTIVVTDWMAMTDAARLRHLEVEGYVVLPDLLDGETIARIKAECADLPMDTAPYSDEQTFARTPPQWHSRTFAKVIGHPPMIRFLKQAMGDDLVFMLGHCVRSGPGVPGLALHSDYQPFGSKQKGWNESSPATIRVLIYLDDLTPDRAPFTILPRSHLSLHEASDPYLRFDNHPDMVTVCLTAGSAIVFNVRAFHGTHPHTGTVRRTMLEYAYRPAWARCVGPVEEWDPAAVAAAPEEAKPYLKPRNSGPAEFPAPNFIGDVPRDLAAGLSTRRW